MPTMQQIQQNGEDYMRLAPGFGVVPPDQRNKGYEKLDFKPGEGGLGNLLESREQKGSEMKELTSALKEFVKELRGSRN